MKWLIRIFTLLLCLCLVTAVVSAAGLPFYDVAGDAWYYPAVSYCYEQGLMNGISVNQFSPDTGLSRAMFVTTLYRAAGSPPVSAQNPFWDVTPGSWYADPVVWAYGEGIVYGMTETSFAPNEGLTRQQLVTLLYRYGKYCGRPMEGGGSLDGFYDAGEVASYAREAFSWAYGGGIIKGTDATHLSPNGSCTRAQCATFLHRFLGGAAVEPVLPNSRPSYGQGSCHELSGQVPVLLLFMDDNESSWTAEEISTFWWDVLVPGLDFIETQAAQRSVYLEFQPGYYANGENGVTLRYNGIIDNDLMDGTISQDLLLQAAQCLGYSSEEAFHDGMAQYCGSDQVVLLVVTDKAGRSYSMNDSYDDGYSYTEYSLLYNAYDSSSPICAGTVAHELLHMFGAEDYYDPYGTYPNRLALAEQLYPNDIMLAVYYDISMSTLGNFTAYTVGWTDELPPECRDPRWWS